MDNNAIMENEFTKTEGVMDYSRHYCRWNDQEKELLERALADDNIKTVNEFLELVSSLTGRTEMAVYSRAYVYHFESYSKKFNKEVTLKVQKEVATVIESEQLALNIPTKEELDSLDNRIIFDLYEKLNDFNKKVNALQEENETLRKYHDSSEQEIARLKNEHQTAIEDRNRAIVHIKNIQSLILNLSQSAFGRESIAQNQELMQKVVV